MNPSLDNLEKLIMQAQEAWEGEAIQEELEKARERLSEMVCKNPARTLGIALLAGFIIGIITNKGRNE